MGRGFSDSGHGQTKDNPVTNRCLYNRNGNY